MNYMHNLSLTVSKSLVEFSKAVNEVIRPQILNIPTERMWENSRKLEDKYHIPGFGVDGILLNYEGKPYGLPANRIAQTFFSRYAINAQWLEDWTDLSMTLNLEPWGHGTIPHYLLTRHFTMYSYKIAPVIRKHCHSYSLVCTTCSLS